MLVQAGDHLVPEPDPPPAQPQLVNPPTPAPARPRLAWSSLDSPDYINLTHSTHYTLWIIYTLHGLDYLHFTRSGISTFYTLHALEYLHFTHQS